MVCPDLEVWATDASADALAVAADEPGRRSAGPIRLPPARVRLAEGSWFDALPPGLARPGGPGGVQPALCGRGRLSRSRPDGARLGAPRALVADRMRTESGAWPPSRPSSPAPPGGCGPAGVVVVEIDPVQADAAVDAGPPGRLRPVDHRAGPGRDGSAWWWPGGDRRPIDLEPADPEAMAPGRRRPAGRGGGGGADRHRLRAGRRPVAARGGGPALRPQGAAREVALPVLVEAGSRWRAVAGPLDSAAAHLADRFWPGPLTLVVPRPADSPPTWAGRRRPGQTVGVRWPDHPVVASPVPAARAPGRDQCQPARVTAGHHGQRGGGDASPESTGWPSSSTGACATAPRPRWWSAGAGLSAASGRAPSPGASSSRPAPARAPDAAREPRAARPGSAGMHRRSGPGCTLHPLPFADRGRATTGGDALVFSNIVVGTDGSETAAAAVALAVDWPASRGPSSTWWSGCTPRRRWPCRRAGPTSPTPQAGASLRGVAQQHAGGRGRGVEGLETEIHTGVGDPADVIIWTADQVGADLIVVGSKGLRGTRRILGSVPNSRGPQGRLPRPDRPDHLSGPAVRSVVSPRPGPGVDGPPSGQGTLVAYGRRRSTPAAP